MNETSNQEEKTIYEIGYHILPTADEAEVPKLASDVKSLIEKKGGAVISEEMPRLTVLAYEISKDINSKKHKFNKAFFGWIKFEMDPVNVSEVKNKTEENQNILRFIIVKTVRENTIHTPKVPMFKRESREEEADKTQEKPKASEEEIDKSIDELVIG